MHKALTVTAALAAVAAVSACSNPTGKAWAITYEVTAEGTGTLSNISYAETVNRYQNSTTKHELAGPLGLPWKLDVVIGAGEQAEVTAKPSAGTGVLSCRILLDGTKELAKATAPAAGQPVTCTKKTDS
ncbi:hypothetical protein GCM10010174_55200 [Kutzneria viridogrisea]|uniref:MmpS family membrane protein n=2 Tax=Kutzneria TaxID=43356 RepID=A0ABR6BKK3_9PSEU|nr:hypothetical protein [Kutzneria albida]AHH95215.1 putative secreted protein [Kutzneria albida DSM 43870]MBA8927428.1 hypothetical protein [Kutzneria viridogrisea]